MEGWIEWAGGDRPVAALACVEVRFRAGDLSVDEADQWDWEHEHRGGDIVAYRVVQQGETS